MDEVLASEFAKFGLAECGICRRIVMAGRLGVTKAGKKRCRDVLECHKAREYRAGRIREPVWDMTPLPKLKAAPDPRQQVIEVEEADEPA